MFIRDAKALADNLVEQMRPHCERVEIAGSIRRGCQVVKDMEIVAVPKWHPGEIGNLFGDAEMLNGLLVWAFDAEARAILQWIKPGTSEIIPWEPKRDGKYWRALLSQNIKLDLFITTLQQWGIIFLIRTGSAEFSQGVMTYAKRNTSLHVENGALTDDSGRALETFEERDAFDLLQLDYVEPRERAGFQAVLKGGRPPFEPGYGIKRLEVMR